jgi:hypothetical protein
MSEDRRRKPKPEDVTLIPAAAFEREVSVLFQVPPSELTAEKRRVKRPRAPNQSKKGAA